MQAEILTKQGMSNGCVPGEGVWGKALAIQIAL